MYLTVKYNATKAGLILLKMDEFEVRNLEVAMCVFVQSGLNYF